MNLKSGLGTCNSANQLYYLKQYTLHILCLYALKHCEKINQGVVTEQHCHLVLEALFQGLIYQVWYQVLINIKGSHNNGKNQFKELS